jgi:hypothetical protein
MTWLSAAAYTGTYAAAERQVDGMGTTMGPGGRICGMPGSAGYGIRCSTHPMDGGTDCPLTNSHSLASSWRQGKKTITVSKH